MNKAKREAIEKAVIKYDGIWNHTIFECLLRGITEFEFEQVKAELQNKPSWADAPEWANWLAQGENGFWEWHSDKPVIFYNGWDIDKGKNLKWDAAGDGKVIGDWKATLEQRPEPPILEETIPLPPFISTGSSDWLVMPRVGDKIIANFPTKKDGKNAYEPRLCEVLRLGIDVDAAGEFVVMCINKESPEYTAVTWIDQWRPTKGESNS